MITLKDFKTNKEKKKFLNDFWKAKSLGKVTVDLETFDVRKHKDYKGYIVQITHHPGLADKTLAILTENDKVKIRHWVALPDGDYSIDHKYVNFKDILKEITDV